MSTILYFYSLLLICIFPIFSFDRINLDQSCKSSNQCTLHKWTILDSYSEEFVHLETDPPNSKTIEQFPIIVKNIYPNTKSTDFTLRTEFHFPKENLLQNLILGIHLQAIGDAYSIYLNGSLIGKDGEVKNGKVIYSRYGVNVNYPIRLMNLKEGKNILVIYLQGNPKFNLLGLFRTKGYYIDTYDKILYESRDRIGLILIGLYFFFGIFYLFIYFKVRHEKNYLYFSILSLSVFIYSVSRDGIFYEYGLDSTTGYKLELMAVYISPLFLGIFLKSLFFERLGKYLKFYITYCTLLFITTPFMKQDFIIYVQLAWQISVFVTVFFYFYIFYTAQKQKLESARRLMISFFIMIFFLVYDILDSIFFKTGFLFSKYTFFVFIIGVVGLLTNRFINMYETIEKLNVTLEDKVEKRTKELNETLEEMKKLKEHQEKINIAKDQFFSIISHDLKSPIYAFKNFLNIIYKNYNKLGEDKKKEIIEIMKISIDNTYKLLINLIDWSKSQTGMIILNPIQINLYEFINSSIQLLSLSAEAKSIKIKVHIDNKKYVIADYDLLTTIFSNLISNAIKFTPNSGEIEIGVIESYEDLQTIIYVKDNGIGIDSEIIPNLFRIDKKISYLGTNHETGSGLGLILCKEFIEKHGGKIWLESEVNKGSTFYFTLPN